MISLSGNVLLHNASVLESRRETINDSLSPPVAGVMLFT